MHSLAQRLSTLTSMVTSAMFVVGILVSIVTFIGNNNTITSLRFKHTIKPDVILKNTRNYGGSKNRPKENVRFKFDIVADFADLVDWNTKQIFVYVYIDLDDSTENSIGDNKLVIWDKILDDTNNMYINYKNVKSKYSVWDYKSDLQGRPAHFKLGYNIQPYIGPLTFGELDLDHTVIL